MPYQAPGVGDDRVDWILLEVAKAQDLLDQKILEAQNLPDTEPSKLDRIRRLNQMKREVDTSFRDLDQKLSVWADRDIRSFYTRGHQTAAAQLSTGFSFTLPHREALDLISFDAYDDVATRLQQVSDGFAANIELQKIYESLDPSQVTAIQAQGRSAVAQLLLTGEDPRKLAKVLAQDLWSQGIQIVDSGGRQWNPETYTRMLIRTKSANAYNAGSMNKYAEEGIVRVKVFDGVEDDPECAEANGQIWSLEYAMQNVIQHPNCRRAFAPERGDGPVDKRSAKEYSVIFDRVALGIAGVAALRSFRNTGEINVSSTLARLVLEVASANLGFGLPVIDQFVTGAIGQGFRNLDALVEGYVDPILYAAGLIQDIPARALLSRTTADAGGFELFMRSIERSVEAGAAKLPGNSPQVQAVLKRIGELTDQAVIIAGDLIARPTPDPGALRWAEYVAGQLIGTNRLGQITGETILQLKRGEFETIREAWGEATDYVDQMAVIRRQHQALMIANYEEAVETAQTMGQARNALIRILDEDTIPPTTFPAEVDQLVRNYRTVEGLPVSLSRRHISDLEQKLTQVHYAAFHRSQELKDLVKHRDVKALPFPASAGPDFPSEAADYWNLADFADDVAELQRKVGGALSSPIYDINTFASGGEAIVKIMRDPNGAQALRDGVLNFRSTKVFARQVNNGAAPDFKNLLLEQGILREDDIEFIDIDGFINLIGHHLQELSFDGTDVRFLGDIVDDAEITEILDDVFLWSRTIFLQAEFLEPEFPTLFIRLLNKAGGDKTKINTLWQLAVGNFEKRPLHLHLTSVTRSTEQSLRKALSSEFSDVRHIDGGINGSQILVQVDSGNWLFLKIFRGNGVQGRTPGSMSQVLTSFVARELGEIEAPPTGVFYVGDQIWGLVHPGLMDSIDYGDYGQGFRSDQARRLALLDLVSDEYDGNVGNYMIHEYNETAFSIDSEAGWFHHRDRWRVGAPNLSRMREQFEAWSELDDVTFLGNDPAVRLVRLTEPEVDFLAQGERLGTDIFYRELQVPILQDVDGDFHLVTGRVGVAVQDGDEVWDPAFFLTDSELEFVLKPLEDHIEDFSDEIRRVFGGLPEGILSDMADEVGAGVTFDEAVEYYATRAAEGMVDRLTQYINGGMIDISGGTTEYIGVRGLRATVGEPIAYADEFGVERFGTVIGIYEDINGEMRAHIAVGVGFKQGTGGFNRLRGTLPYHNIIIDEASVLGKVPEPNFGVELQARLADINMLTPSNRHAPVYELDDAGLVREARTQHIQIENHANEGITFYYRLGKARTNARLDDEITTRLTQIVEEVLDEKPFYERPLRVVISPRVFETSDGRKAFGMFDVEERIVYVSATGLFPDVAADVNGKLLFDSIDALNDSVDYTHFERVVRHEVGHAQAVGQEIRRRVELSEIIIEQILEDAPALNSVDDFAAWAEDQLRLHGRFDLLGSENPLQTLVQFRVSLVEDVINSNQVAAAKRLANQGLPDDISPEIVHAIRRGEAEAHQELIAEIVESGDPIRWATDNNVEVDDVVSLVFPAKRIPREEEWFGPGLSTYLERILDEDAFLVPINRNATRAFWNEAEINSEFLRARGREPFGGFTYDIVTEFEPPRGWAVAIEKNQLVIENFSEISDDEFKRILREYAAEHRPLLDQPDWFLGGWHDTEKNLFYLDTSKVLDDEVSAASFGFQENQRAIFNLENFTEKPVTDAYANLDEYIDAEIPSYRTTKKGLVDVLQSKNKSRKSFVTDDQGRHPSLSLSAFSEEAQETFRSKMELRTIKTEAGVEVVTTDEFLRGAFESVLERAEELYGIVDPSIEDDAVWSAAHRMVVNRGAKVSADRAETMTEDLRTAIDILQRNDIKFRGAYNDISINYLDGTSMRRFAHGNNKAPNGATVGNRIYLNQSWSKQQESRNRVETILHEMAHIMDPNESLARSFSSRAADLGLDLEEILPGSIHSDINEMWADAFMRAMRGDAPADLEELVFDVLNPFTPGVPTRPGTSHLTIRGEHRFYRKWNRGFRAKSVETNIPLERLAGGAAAMSPNLDADLNYEYALWFATKIAADEPFTQKDVILLKKYYRQISSNYHEYAGEAKDELKRLEKLQLSRLYAQWAKDLRVGMRMSEMDSGQVARTLYAFRKDEFGKGYTVPTSFYNFEKAVMVMRGEMEIQDALGDTKVRSFYNNIVDYKDIVGMHDVTIDFHMLDAALRANTRQGKALAGAGGEPKIDGLAIGIRIILADITRDLWSRGWGLRVGADSPAELQEVIWAVWQYGKRQENQWWGEIPIVLETVSKG